MALEGGTATDDGRGRVPGGRHRRAGGSHRRGVPGRPLRQRVAVWWRRRITAGTAVWRRVSARPGVAHLVRAGERFSDRMGGQFAAAITYFSFLSLVPIVMVAFSAAGFVLSSRPDLLAALTDQVTSLLGSSVGEFIDKAVKQRAAVGIVGLLIAAYSGLNWIGNLRGAVRAQWRPTWQRSTESRGTVGSFLMYYVWDLVSLVGLLAAVLVTFALTAVGTAAQTLVISLLGLQDVHWLTPVFTVGPFLVAIAADVLIFGWMYTVLPYRGYRADRRTLLIGSLVMSACFEVLKAALTILVTRTSSSPTGAVFGSVIGLLLFFNLVARAFLMVAAWIGTRGGAPGREAPGRAIPDREDPDPGAPAGGVPARGVPAGGGDEDPERMRASSRVAGPAPSPAVRAARARGDRRVGAAFGLGAVLGWAYGRRAGRRRRG